MTAFSSLIGGHMDGKGKNFASEIGIWEYGLSKKRLKEIRALENGMGPEEKRLFEKTLGNENLLHGGLKSEFVQMAVKRPDLFAAEIAKRIDSRYGTGASNALGVDAAQAKLAKGELTKEQYDKITKELKTDQVTAQALEVAKAFNRSTGMFYGDQLINATKYAKDAAGIKKSKDYETGLSAYQKTAVGNEVMLHAAWDNLKTTLGVTILPTMIAGINSLAKALDTIGAFFQRHPTLGKMLTHVASALSVMAVVGGGLMLFKAALTGLSLLNIAGIAGAIGGGTGLAGAMGLLLTPAGLAVAAIAAVTAAFWGISKLMALRDGSAAATTAGTLMRDKSALAGLNAKLANSAGLSELQRKGLLAQRSALEKQISSYADTAANKSARYGSMLTSDAGAGRGKSYAQPNTPTPITVVSNTYLDGAPLAKTVTKYQAREAQRGLHNSGSGYDSLRGTPSPAMGR